MYPIKFIPIVKDKIWGGKRLEKKFGKNPGKLPNIGESWELSGVPGDVSVIENGYLAGKTLNEAISMFKDQLVGKRVYAKSGENFPLLFKLIDANDDLSIQVHPNDEVAMKRHNSLGKTEMWYVLDSEKDAYLIIGFKKNTTKKEYLAALEKGEVEDLLQKVPVQAGDVFFIPAGLVHAIGKGALIAEIQQSSDITYRIFDFNRKDAEGNERELHTEQALDVIDFKASKKPKTEYKARKNEEVELASCEYFTTNLLEMDKPKHFHYGHMETFVVYMCLEGTVEIAGGTSKVMVTKGDTVLIPANMKDFTITPESTAKLLEVSID